MTKNSKTFTKLMNTVYSIEHYYFSDGKLAFGLDVQVYYHRLLIVLHKRYGV